jgi:hypothetical protein
MAELIKASHRRYRAGFTLVGLILSLVAQAQTTQDNGTGNGSSGITSATSAITGYFGVGVLLMYAIGAIVGLIGAVKVYSKWNHGDHDTSKVAAAWFGSCIFLVVVATILKSFFGITT